MNRRDVLGLGVPLLFSGITLSAAPCESELDPRTGADYDAYLKKARADAEQPLDSGPLDRVPEKQRAEALRILDSQQPYIWNLNQNDPNGAMPVYKGVIVDWVGAIRIPGVTLESFENILSQYGSYKKWYKPYIFDCYARPISGPGVKNFAVTSILHDVYEKPAPLVPDQHFSFEVRAESNYFRLGSGDAQTLLIRTHAASIRAANSGHPEHADSRMKNNLLPEGRGQGVLWRSDTWWRASAMGSGVYAEYQSLSLARSLDGMEFFSLCSVLRLPVFKDKALESMTVRPRKTVLSVITDTRAACQSSVS